MKLYKERFNLDVITSNPEQLVRTASNFKDGNFYEQLFEQFLRRLPSHFKLLNKTVPWHSIRIILGSYRYETHQIREIVKMWCQLGLVELVPFRGIKIIRDKDELSFLR